MGSSLGQCMLDTISPTVIWTCIIKHIGRKKEDDEVGSIRQEAKLEIK